MVCWFDFLLLNLCVELTTNQTDSMKTRSINPGSVAWKAFLEMGARLAHSPDRLVLLV